MNNVSLYDPRFGLRVSNDLFFRNDPFELLDSFFGMDPFENVGFRSPVIDVRENDKAYLIEAELPGLSEKDVQLEVKDSVLTLKVEKKSPGEGDKTEKEDKDEKWIRRERAEFSFTRSFSLPDNADEEAIEARFKDGVLMIALPKKPEKAPRQVQVKVA
jgi:HSP20 family protein